MPTNISDRRTALRDFSKDLKTTENKLDQAGKKEGAKALQDIKDAGRELGNAADNLGEVANQALGAGANVVIGASEFVKGTGHLGASAVLAAAGGAGAVGEVSANILGRALQFLGRALLGIGNEARAIADIGGRQYTTKDVAGDQFAKTWSQDLLKMSGDQFRLSANSYAESINHLVFGVAGNVALGAIELGKAAKNTLDASIETLKAAKNGGDSVVIEIAEKAVELAMVAVKVVDHAVKYAEIGTDTAGAALQAAGKGLIVAGNAVNSKRGTDTAVVGSGG